ncbi:MAG TPA: hypothetical protein VN808_07885 [Stellaceae bacterium]|nr:hypothetical protein [Stellaceae bacterium]
MLKGLALGLLLGAGLCSAAWAQGSSRFDGQYAGELTLKGIINGDCTEPPLGAIYPLTISGGVVRFKYVARFDTTLTGPVDAKGNFQATGRTKHGFVVMNGHVADGNTLTASIVSPSCQYSFQTKN